MRALEVELSFLGSKIAGKFWNRELLSTHLPVLAFHGWLDNAGTFDRIAPYLPFPLLAVDLPGHGYSEHRASSIPYWVLDSLALPMELKRQLGWERCLFLGHSLGGALITMAKGGFDEGVLGWISIEAFGFLVQPSSKAWKNYRSAWRQFELLRGASAPLYKSREELLLKLAKRGLSPEACEALAQRAARKDEEGMWYFAHDRKLMGKSLLYMNEEQARSFLEVESPPGYVLLARDGMRELQPMIEERIDMDSQAELLWLERGGHHPHLEEPETTAELIRNAYERLARRG